MQDSVIITPFLSRYCCTIIYLFYVAITHYISSAKKKRSIVTRQMTKSKKLKTETDLDDQLTV